MFFYQKGNDSKMGDNSNKKSTGHLFFLEESLYDFSNISIHGSKFMLCI